MALRCFTAAAVLSNLFAPRLEGGLQLRHNSVCARSGKVCNGVYKVGNAARVSELLVIRRPIAVEKA
jgi:hypothetical protein